MLEGSGDDARAQINFPRHGIEVAGAQRSPAVASALNLDCPGNRADCISRSVVARHPGADMANAGRDNNGLAALAMQ